MPGLPPLAERMSRGPIPFEEARPTRELMAAAIETSKGLTAGAPTRLFQAKVAGPLGTGHRFPYAVSRDGKRFLMYVSNVQIPPTISVIVNWPALIAK